MIQESKTIILTYGFFKSGIDNKYNMSYSDFKKMSIDMLQTTYTNNILLYVE